MTMCEYYGHCWVQDGIGTGDVAILWGPVRCLNCGVERSDGDPNDQSPQQLAGSDQDPADALPLHRLPPRSCAC